MASGELQQLIQHFLGNDNAKRKDAEHLYNQACKTVDGKSNVASQLLELMKSSPVENIRSTCAVLLRKLLTRGDTPFWQSLPPASLGMLQNELVAAVETESVAYVRNKVSDTLSTMAASMLSKSHPWPALLPKLLQWAEGEAAARKASMSILGDMALGMGRQAHEIFELSLPILLSNLAQGHTLEVRQAALGAAAKFVVLCDSSPNPKESLERFGAVLLPMLQCIGDFLTASDEVATQEALSLFIEVAEAQISFFKPGMQQVLVAMVQIASSNLEDATKQLSLEFVITLIEEKPGMVRKKMKDLVERVFAISLAWMLELEESETWTAADNDNGDDASGYEVGLANMDRMAMAIGGKTLLPFAFAQTGIPGYLQDPRWQARHAALMTISQISEGCKKAIGQQLGQIVEMVFKYFQDPHPRVRYAAINCIGQIASDFSPALQQGYHQQVITALVTAMDDFNKGGSREVQGHAASCIINFVEGMQREVMLNYASGVLMKLLELVQVEHHYVREQSLTALAAMADCLGDGFAPFYDQIMPGLKNMFANLPSETREQQGIRCRAMECITVIGVAVGKSKFGPDADQMMKAIHASHQAIISTDDTQASYIQHAYSRICRVLGADFVPYLAHVIPTLLESAAQDEIQDFDDLDLNAAQDEDDDGSINIRTSILEEKITACGMICCYLEVLGEGYAPYVNQSLELLVPYVEHYADEIREAACTALPLLLDSAIKALGTNGQDHRPFLLEFLNKVLDPLVEAIKDEEVEEVLQQQLQALGDIFQKAGENCLSAAHQETIVVALHTILSGAIDQRKARAERNKEDAEDLDEECMESQQEQEQQEADTLLMYMQCIGELIKVQKQRVLPLLEKTLAIFLEMLRPEYSAPDRRLAVLVLDDVIEFGGEMMLPMLPMIIPYFLQYVEDPDDGLRQASAYGIGQMAQHGGPQIAAQTRPFLDALSRVILAPNSREGLAVHATDNCISAFGKFLQFQTAAVGELGAALNTWVGFLPVTGDLEEGKAIYNRLLMFCEQDLNMVLGPQAANLSRVMVALTDAVGTQAVDVALTQRILRLMHGLSAQMPDAFKAVAGQMNQNQAAKLQEMLSHPPSP